MKQSECASRVNGSKTEEVELRDTVRAFADWMSVCQLRVLIAFVTELYGGVTGSK